MTMHYTENTQVLAGLQADSKRDNGDRISIIDYALEKIRELGLKDSNILDLQGYYRKTIERNTAFHGIFCKQFNGLPNDLSLVITGSQDCQYPVEYWLSYDKCLIFRLGKFKNTIKGLEELQVFNLLDELTLAVNIFDWIFKQSITIPFIRMDQGNFRRIRRQTIAQQDQMINMFNNQ